MPPPPAPHCAPSSQTCSEAGWVASSIVVPPTERTYGWLAGSPSESRFWPEGGTTARALVAPSSPVSPVAERTVWPCAAACSKRRFSACWTPGSPTCASCSQTPQLEVMTWSTSLFTDLRVLVEAARSGVRGLVHVDVRLRGQRGDVLDVEGRLVVGTAGARLGLAAVHGSHREPATGEHAFATGHLCCLGRAEVARVEVLDIGRQKGLQLVTQRRAGRCRNPRSDKGRRLRRRWRSRRR